ncbi:4-hydroxy-tetrahydrodipicolinate synthase [Variovorax boronicumulans]|uniref:4-hydroxy-tetrahydrodipicolinate synthase n=1 Tax=Variovorax boronicumulans TaxID=436515 RepID=A0AAW8D998_9BURK|nr:dihydrodipicolinate synthase family protein [Variovorax boronicumulans]MDP9896854.1 4-hydroxy-tetrahydrodipicolinate synthase [Variovorax boronicumulans]MDP9993942.1 4-hydroxy-tetrahydrodipicolinate synthase [Variovorax boronicumulans]MDQ0005195.1 4-hydroxy-tetrahydrodipicolinate synthase [Variovorax boronicumulans]MDQ0038986.1 4-hydroxy-tetrahydrodipicolinate synthase [Variovorax boronicumulans]MDQ0044729.1 4-hydroxy-tetrahydrodipicolinate synthase [Variovorax boronicumulans]
MSTKYQKQDAKAYARENFRGVWAATITPFREDLSFDEEGFRANLRHWVRALRLGGLFVSGKQGEFFSMSLAERKRSFEIAVEEANGHCGIVTSCSDTNLDVVLDLARHSQAIGADYIVVHSPVLHFHQDAEETVYEYYRYLSEQLEIGIALWNHPDCGYVMSPQLCARIAELPNIVAIKYSVDRALYSELTRLAGDKILVSTASEEEWLDNIVELGWQLYLCSTPPFLLQSAVDQRINEYTRLAFEGKIAEARAVRDSLEPARAAFRSARPSGTPQAYSKYWLEMLGQVGGPVRRPLLNLTDTQKAAARDAFARSGLKLA